MNGDKIHSKTQSFHDGDEAARTRLEEELTVEMRKHLNGAIKELEDGVLHGLVIVRVNQEHKVVASIALCNQASSSVASGMQDIAMDLMTHDAPPQVRSLIELLRKLESRRPG